MAMHSHAAAGVHDVYRPHPVSDERLATLDLTVLVLLVVMSLGPLSVYAIFGS